MKKPLSEGPRGKEGFYGTWNYWSGRFRTGVREQALKGGHTVKLSNSHGPESLRAVVNSLGSGAVAATKNEAAACEIVLLVVPWDKVPETLASLPKWKNQILIDGTNPFHGRPEVTHLPISGTCLPASWLRLWRQAHG